MFNLNGTFVNKLSIHDPSTQKFPYIGSIAVNDDHIFIADSIANQIKIFDLDGKFVNKIGTTYTDRKFDETFGIDGQNLPDDEFADPSAIAVTDEYLFVFDRYYHQIKIFDIDGTYVNKFRAYESLEPSYGKQTSISANDTHVFIIAQSPPNNIRVFDLNGTLVNEFGNTSDPSSYTDLFDSPSAIAVNSNYIFVSDIPDRIQVFELDGTPVTKFDNCDYRDDDIANSLKITYVNSEQNLLYESGIVYEPMGIAIKDDHIFIVNQHKDREQIFDWRCVGDSIVEIKIDDGTPVRSAYSDIDFRIGKWLSFFYGVKY